MDLANYKFTKSHEWVRVEGEFAFVGISDFAQAELGDIVYVELPEVGDELEKGEAFGNIEAVKAVSELFAPISGEVVEINENLEDTPELVNNSAHEEGWMIKIKIAEPSELDELMSFEDYEAHTQH